MSQKDPIMTSWPIDTLRFIRVLSPMTELLEIVELALIYTLTPIVAEAETAADGWITEIQFLNPKCWRSEKVSLDFSESAQENRTCHFQGNLLCP